MQKTFEMDNNKLCLENEGKPIAVWPEAEGWQPIETAPKDGRQIIIADFTIGRTHQVIASWNSLKGCWCTVRHNLGQFLDYSHWQPLAEPPKEG